MSLYEIDHSATQRRVEAAAAGGRRALGETARSSEDADKRFKDMLQRQAKAKQAMDERIAQARRQARPDPEVPPRTPPKPTTLALGADEFREAREARKATEPPDTDEPDTPARPIASDRRPPRPAPPPRRPRPRPGADDGDDMSGRTWLR